MVVKVDIGSARSADNSEDAVLVAIENRGSSAMCASFLARVETVSKQAYDVVASPKTLYVPDLGPGKVVQGSIEFPVARGERPPMLFLQLQDLPTGCGAEVRTLHSDASTPSVIVFDLYDLVGLDPRDLPKSKRPAAMAYGFTFPTCRHCPDPSYSASARKARFQGNVELQVLVTADGATADVQLTQGSGYEDLDQKSVDTVRTWRFKPATGPNGNTISISVPVQISFRLLL